MANTYFQYHVALLFKRNQLATALLSKTDKTIHQVNQFILNYNFVDNVNNPNRYTNS